MANMSYCRFQNTLSDLRDCYRHLDEMGENGEEGELSKDEQAAAEELVALCTQVHEMYGVEED
jgi:hypothetical protein